MKVHLIKKQSIEDYVLKNARSRASFKIWLSVIKRVDWEEPNDILRLLIVLISLEKVLIE